MAGTARERFGLARLARATQFSLDWRNWGQGAQSQQLETLQPLGEPLDKLIEAEIIPRLMLAHRESRDGASPPQTDKPVARRFDRGEIDRFARKAVTHDSREVVEEIDRLLQAGAPPKDILLKLLAPAARRLGELWESDEFDFTEVTIGLMKLHRALQRVNEEAPTGMGAGAASPRILLSPAPGEQHVFGLLMVGDFFSRSGWRVRTESEADMNQLASTIAKEHFDVIGLSASSSDSLNSLGSEIRRLRTKSLNPSVVIMVGGRLFNEDIGLARRIGADATAIDGVRAVVTAERMVYRLACVDGAPQH